MTDFVNSYRGDADSLEGESNFIKTVNTNVVQSPMAPNFLPTPNLAA